MDGDAASIKPAPATATPAAVDIKPRLLSRLAINPLNEADLNLRDYGPVGVAGYFDCLQLRRDILRQLGGSFVAVGRRYSLLARTVATLASPVSKRHFALENLFRALRLIFGSPLAPANIAFEFARSYIFKRLERAKTNSFKVLRD